MLQFSHWSDCIEIDTPKETVVIPLVTSVQYQGLREVTQNTQPTLLSYVYSQFGYIQINWLLVVRHIRGL